jgi:hypothetical protein
MYPKSSQTECLRCGGTLAQHAGRGRTRMFCEPRCGRIYRAVARLFIGGDSYPAYPINS